MRKIEFNGKSAVLDQGLMFGRGVFETILVKEKPLFLCEHIERLNKSLEIIGVEPLSYDEIVFINKLIDERKISNLVLKIIVTESNILISTRKNSYTKENYDSGMRLKISSCRRNETSILNKIKSINYLENILLKEKAKTIGYDDVLFLNFKGEVCETSCANIFIVKDDYIMTPYLESGLLNGIVRSLLIDKFNIIEKSITLEEVLSSDEVFITNSLIGIIKVNKINDRIYNSEKYSFIIRKFYEDYIDEIGGKLIDK